MVFTWREKMDEKSKETTEGHEQVEKENLSEPFSVVAAVEFQAFNFEAPLTDIRHTEGYSLATLFQKAEAEAKEAGDESRRRVYSFLNAICLIHFTPHDKARPWGPMWEMGDRRSAIPADFVGDQTSALVEVIPAVKNPILRSRLADICWLNNRKLGAVSAIAVDAYCECVEKLLEGQLIPEHGGEARGTFEAVEFLERGLQIAYATNKKGVIPERVKDALQSLYKCATIEKAYVAFHRTAELALYYSLIEVAQIASDAEALAVAANGQYPIAVKAVWDLAAHLYERLDKDDDKRRCQLGAVDQILAMRKQVSSASAEAHWVMDALQALRHVQNVEEKEEELELDLRRLQKASMKEMAAIPIEMDIEGERERYRALFSNYRLPEALKQFALITGSPRVEMLKENALKTIKKTPLMAMMGISHVDEEGKTIRKSEGAGTTGEPDETWFRREIERAEGIRRFHAVAAAIEPARHMIHAVYNIDEAYLEPIVGVSFFVPESQRAIFSLGFTRFFQRDYISAAHLLLPQLEPSLRHLLKVRGVAPVKRFDDGTEEDLDLGGMLNRLRPELETILTDTITAEIERLFHSRPGPALRHEIAHGLLSGADCYQPSTIYAIWFMYRLCVLFAIKNWDTVIAPYLDSISPDPLRQPEPTEVAVE